MPANLTRYGLSQIINHLLALGEYPLQRSACTGAAVPLHAGRSGWGVADLLCCLGVLLLSSRSTLPTSLPGPPPQPLQTPPAPLISSLMASCCACRWPSTSWPARSARCACWAGCLALLPRLFKPHYAGFGTFVQSECGSESALISSATLPCHCSPVTAHLPLLTCHCSLASRFWPATGSGAGD